MKTKTLLLTAAVIAAGAATSMAQVFSVNVVGYVTTTIPAGKFALISNPLQGATNTVGVLFAAAPDGTIIYKYGTAGYVSTEKGFGAFDQPNISVVPGEGVFVKAPVGAPVTITFVGEVQQGAALTVNLPVGFSIASSRVPQAGTLSQLSFPGVDGDKVYKFNVATQQYDTLEYSFGAWAPDPVIPVGDAVFVQKAAAITWTKSFTVN